MRDIPLKADNVGDTLPADRFNANFRNELQNVVESADFTLDADGGPDTNVNMLSQSIAAYANSGSQYVDSGAANAYVLGIATNLKSVSKYYDGMKVVFKAGNSNTGASTVNVASLGAKNITRPDGTVLSALDIVADNYVSLVYSLSNDRFELSQYEMGNRLSNGDLAFAAGKGISFDAYAAGNLLDDFEEGTFSGSAANITWNGSYVKIGKLVAINLRVSGTSGVSYSSQVNNLPFVNGSLPSGGGASGVVNGANNMLTVFIAGSSSTVTFWSNDAGSAVASTGVSDIQTSFIYTI